MTSESIGNADAPTGEPDAFLRALDPVLSRVRRGDRWVKASGTHPRHLTSPLTDDAMRKHLSGGPAIGAAPIARGASTTRIALFDLDDHAKAMRWETMVRHARKLIAEAARHGMRAVPWRSRGGSGIHLYFVWQDEQDAYSVRVRMRHVALDADLTVGDDGIDKGAVEVFPKQDAVAADRWGSMFILPGAGASVPLLGPELKVGTRDDMLGLDWPLSDPVPRERRTMRKPQPRVAPADVPKALERLRGALEVLRNDDIPYEEWRNVVLAAHEACGGCEDGRELVRAWSSKSGKHDDAELDRKVWDWATANLGRERDRIGPEYLFNMARGDGWVDPSIIFDDLTVEATAPDPAQPPLPVPAEAAQTAPRPRYVRFTNGEIRPTVGNVLAALRDPMETGWRIAHDAFADQIMMAPAGTSEWRAMRDGDYVLIRERLEHRGFRTVAHDLARQVVGRVAEEFGFDSAQEWLRTEVPAWDGTPRAATFLSVYFGAKDDAYTRAVGEYIWSGLAARVLDPGHQIDMVPTLIGMQGTGKSSGTAAMVPSPEHFADLRLHERDDDLARLMRGKLVIELPELTGLGKREREWAKAFITRRHEQWVPKFREFATTYPRRALLIGTSNPVDFLDDSTGNRRWLPVEVGTTDRDALVRDRLQLWAEGRELFLDGGVRWREAERLARDRHEDFTVDDPWASLVIDSMKHREAGKPFTTSTALMWVDVRSGDMDKGKRNRMAALLQSLGCARVNTWIAGKKVRAWHAPTDLEHTEHIGTDAFEDLSTEELA